MKLFAQAITILTNMAPICSISFLSIPHLFDYKGQATTRQNTPYRLSDIQFNSIDILYVKGDESEHWLISLPLKPCQMYLQMFRAIANMQTTSSDKTLTHWIFLQLKKVSPHQCSYFHTILLPDITTVSMLSTITYVVYCPLNKRDKSLFLLDKLL